MDQNQMPMNDRFAMAENVQGFELPRGCLMTSVVILLPIVTMVAGLVHASNFNDGLMAVLIPAIWISIYALAQNMNYPNLST